MSGSGLIGYTGFVGSTLNRASSFDFLFNSQNIADIQGQSFDLLICAAPQAKKWWANQHPEEDLAIVQALIHQLSQTQADRFVLISTIDVFPQITDADESFDCTRLENHPYGQHRLLLEQFVAAHFPQSFIVRLPALFGQGLKKNALFDLLNLNQVEKIHPSSRFQWYDMSDLWGDVQRLMSKNISLVVLATEPVAMQDIQARFFADVEIGQAAASPTFYDIRTLHAEALGGSNGYIASCHEILERIGQFVAAERGQRS